LITGKQTILDIHTFWLVLLLLTKLMKEKKAFLWTPEVEAFQTLKGGTQ
jgi:hypothetical protein